jgi:hypothetical protein
VNLYIQIHTAALWSLFIVVLGGLVVSMLAIVPLDPRFAGSNPAEDDGFLKAIEVRCTTSFGGK